MVTGVAADVIDLGQGRLIDKASALSSRADLGAPTKLTISVLWQVRSDAL